MNDFELLDRVVKCGFAEYKKVMEKKLLYRLLRAVRFNKKDLARRLKMDPANLTRLCRKLKVQE